MTVVNVARGLMAELMSAVVFSGICDRHPEVRFVLEEAGVGWVPFLFWRFDREYDFGGPSTPVFKPTIRLSNNPPSSSSPRASLPSRSGERAACRGFREIALPNFL